MDGQIDGWSDGQIDGWSDRQRGEHSDGWTKEMNRRTKSQTDGQIN